MGSDKADETEASNDAQRISRFEHHLITVMFGFSRWLETCMNAANVTGLSSLDILVLHALNRRLKGQRLSEIGLVMNIDDTHLIAYSLKKLMNAKLVVAARYGRERYYTTTEEGDRACIEYHRIREKYLIEKFFSKTEGGRELERIGEVLSHFTSTYDRAGRTAMLATATRPKAPPLKTKR